MCPARTRCGQHNSQTKPKGRNTMRRNAAMAILILLIVWLSSPALAQKATVLRVVVVKTDNPAAYVQEIEKGRQIMKSLGVQAETRVWQARFAGQDAGTVVVT